MKRIPADHVQAMLSQTPFEALMFMFKVEAEAAKKSLFEVIMQADISLPFRIYMLEIAASQ